MNIRQTRKLNESAVEITPTQAAQMNSTTNIDVEKYQKLFDNDSNMFEFSCGAKMAKMNTGIDTRFGLQWHAENTTTIDEFFESIEKFIDNKLSSSDKSKLTVQYRQLYPEA